MAFFVSISLISALVLIISCLLKRFSKDFCTQKVKANKTMKGQAVPNHRRIKDKKVENNIDSAAHN
jgi:flagellar biogenesis protein FliO